MAAFAARLGGWARGAHSGAIAAGNKVFEIRASGVSKPDHGWMLLSNIASFVKIRLVN
jgi:hypothetical protein